MKFKNNPHKAHKGSLAEKWRAPLFPNPTIKKKKHEWFHDDFIIDLMYVIEKNNFRISTPIWVINITTLTSTNPTEDLQRSQIWVPPFDHLHGLEIDPSAQLPSVKIIEDVLFWTKITPNKIYLTGHL